MPLVINPQELPSGTVGKPYSQQLTANGGTPPYSWSWSGAPPPGLTLKDDSITGTPTAARKTTLSLEVKDTSQSAATQEYKLVIDRGYWRLHDADAWLVARYMGIALLTGCAIAGFGGWSHWLEALLWAGACSAVGWAGGFLFGIPRSLASEGQSMPQPNQPAPSSLRVNTNLEQISDWLTKIIVGVTLVQIRPVLNKLYEVAFTIAASLGGGSNRISFAYALLFYFSITGFLGSYLLTRLFLQRAFRNVDQ